MAKTITVTLHHELGREAARTRLEQGLRELRGDIATYVTEMREHWNGNHVDLTFRTPLAGADATVEVEDKTIVIAAKLPFLLTMFASRIEDYLKGVGQDFFASA